MKLEEIEEICNNATPAPWTTRHELEIQDMFFDLKFVKDAEFISLARESMSKLLAVAQAAKECLHYINRDYSEWTEPLKKNLEELEKECTSQRLMRNWRKE